MHTLFITGATGNVGSAVVAALNPRYPASAIVVGVRDVDKERNAFDAAIRTRRFDFEDAATYAPALEGCTALFLLRPPQISAVQKIFAPLIREAKKSGIAHIVFISVQGVEGSRFIPHHKIEKLIVESGLAYTFLRPAYFMQNFTGALRAGLVEKSCISLPAGSAPFTLVDVQDVGDVAAVVLANPSAHAGKAYDLTSAARYSFAEMADLLSKGLDRKITYRSPGLIPFFMACRKASMPVGLILVMMLLHYLPRFRKPPAITTCVPDLLGRAPVSFTRFVAAHKAILNGKTAQPHATA